MRSRPPRHLLVSGNPSQRVALLAALLGGLCAAAACSGGAPSPAKPPAAAAGPPAAASPAPAGTPPLQKIVVAFVSPSETMAIPWIAKEAGLFARYGFEADVPYTIHVPAREAPLTTARVEPTAGRGIAVGRTFGRYPTLNQRWSPRQTFINRTSKLTPHQQHEAIKRRDEGEPLRDIARSYAVSHSTISRLTA